MATSEYQLGEVPNSHSQRGQKASQACGLGNLSPSSDSELYGQGDLKKIILSTLMQSSQSPTVILVAFNSSFPLRSEICMTPGLGVRWGPLRREKVKRVDAPAWSCQ